MLITKCLIKNFFISAYFSAKSYTAEMMSTHSSLTRSTHLGSVPLLHLLLLLRLVLLLQLVLLLLLIFYHCTLVMMMMTMILSPQRAWGGPRQQMLSPQSQHKPAAPPHAAFLLGGAGVHLYPRHKEQHHRCHEEHRLPHLLLHIDRQVRKSHWVKSTMCSMRLVGSTSKMNLTWP